MFDNMFKLTYLTFEVSIGAIVCPIWFNVALDFDIQVKGLSYDNLPKGISKVNYFAKGIPRFQNYHRAH